MCFTLLLTGQGCGPKTESEIKRDSSIEREEINEDSEETSDRSYEDKKAVEGSNQGRNNQSTEDSGQETNLNESEPQQSHSASESAVKMDKPVLNEWYQKEAAVDCVTYEITWSEIIGADGYEVEFSSFENEYEGWKTSVHVTDERKFSESFSYIDRILKVRVRAFGTEGYGEWSEEKSIEVVAGYPKNKDSLEADNSLQNSENIINNDEYENLKEGGSSGGIHGTYTYQLVDPPPSWSDLESYASWEALFLRNGICQIDFCYRAPAIANDPSSYRDIRTSYEVPYTVDWDEGMIYLDNSEYLDVYESNFESCAVEDVQMIGE